MALSFALWLGPCPYVLVSHGRVLFSTVRTLNDRAQAEVVTNKLIVLVNKLGEHQANTFLEEFVVEVDAGIASLDIPLKGILTLHSTELRVSNTAAAKPKAKGSSTKKAKAKAA